MKAVMYHYVRPASPVMPYLRYLSLDDFRRQLDHFEKTWGFVGKDEFLAALDGGPVPGGVVLTFDDGVSDHLEFVVPELRRRGLWGIFYVAAGPYLSGKLLDVHRAHFLLGAFGARAMLGELRAQVRPEMLAHEHVKEFRELTYPGQGGDDAAVAFKRVLNYFLSDDWRPRVLSSLFAAHGIDEAALVRSFYVPEASLREFASHGMVLGSHSVSHPVLSKLTEKDQATEIRESFSFLERAAGPPELKTFCYPYGGFHTFTPATERLLEAEGCRFAFNVEPRDITSEDLRLSLRRLPRWDCNAFPHGQAVRAKVEP